MSKDKSIMIEEFKPKSTIVLEGSDTVSGEVGSTVDINTKAKIVSMEEQERDGKKHKHQRLEIVSKSDDKEDSKDKEKSKEDKVSGIKALIQASGSGKGL